MNRPAWINITLFALSQRRVSCLILAGILLAVWWNLADFYVCNGFPDIPELSDTLLVAGTFFPLLFGLVVATRIQVRRGLRSFAEPAPKFKWGKTTDISRAMLAEISSHCDGLSRRYVNWLGDYGRDRMGWLSALGLPLFATFLALPPLHSGLMECISNLSSKTPPSLMDRKSQAKADDVIFGIDSVAEQGNEALVATGLVFGDGEWNRTPDSKIETASTTYLIFHGGDYPHVHRRLHVLGCALPNCSVSPAASSSPPLHPRTCFSSLRRASACFEYWQPLAAYRPLPLNVRAVIQTLWGRPLDSVRIE